MTNVEILIRRAAVADIDAVTTRQVARESDYPGPGLIEKWIKANEFWLAEYDTGIVGWFSLQNTFYEGRGLRFDSLGRRRISETRHRLEVTSQG